MVQILHQGLPRKGSFCRCLFNGISPRVHKQTRGVGAEHFVSGMNEMPARCVWLFRSWPRQGKFTHDCIPHDTSLYLMIQYASRWLMMTHAIIHASILFCCKCLDAYHSTLFIDLKRKRWWPHFRHSSMELGQRTEAIRCFLEDPFAAWKLPAETSLKRWRIPSFVMPALRNMKA